MNCVVYMDLRPFQCAQFLGRLKLSKLGNFLLKMIPVLDFRWLFIGFYKHCCPVAQVSFNMAVITGVFILSFKIAFYCDYAFSKIPLLCNELITVESTGIFTPNHCPFDVVAIDVNMFHRLQ